MVKRVLSTVLVAGACLGLAGLAHAQTSSCNPTKDPCCDPTGSPLGMLSYLCCDKATHPDGSCAWQAAPCASSTGVAAELSTCAQPPGDAGATLHFDQWSPRQGFCLVSLAQSADPKAAIEPVGCLTIIPYADADSLSSNPWGVTAWQERTQVPVDPRWDGWELCYGAPPCANGSLVKTPGSNSCCTLPTPFRTSERTGNEWVETFSSVTDVPPDMSPDAPYCKPNRKAACAALGPTVAGQCVLIDDGCDAGSTAWCCGGCTTSTTCAINGAECGTIPDGCGGTLDCGSCGDAGVCRSGHCGGSPSAPTDGGPDGGDDAGPSVSTPPHSTCSASRLPARPSGAAWGFVSGLLAMVAVRRRLRLLGAH